MVCALFSCCFSWVFFFAWVSLPDFQECSVFTFVCALLFFGEKVLLDYNLCFVYTK